MEWKMEVYSPDLELLGILETYDALVVEQWAFEPGSFSLQSVLTPQTRDLLRPENILWLEGETAGIIEVVQASVSESGDILSVKGPLLDGILSRRILWGQYNLYGSPPALMYEVVRDCAISPTRGSAAQRTIPHLALAGEAPEDARRIRKQSTGDTLTDFLTEVGQANGVAHGVRFNPIVPQMEFWARLGVDRTVHQTAVDPVLYSTELDDVLSSEYSYDASGYRNVALVAGEGEADARRSETVSEEPKERLLPEGYTQLEYAESTGVQFVDTGVFVSKNTTAIVDVDMDDAQLSWRSFFGSMDTQGDTNLGFFISNVSSQRVKMSYLEGTAVYLNVPNLIERNTIVLGRMGMSVGEISGKPIAVETSLVSSKSLYLFAYNNDGVATARSTARIYRATIYEGQKISNDFFPCKTDSGQTGFYDVIMGAFHPGEGSAPLIDGPESSKAPEPGGLSRRETYVDARDLQSNADPDEPMTEEEYLEALKTRGKESLSDHQLVQSFSATVRTLDPTYVYGVDFFLGDTITVTDERLGLSVSALVEGVERSVGKNGEDLILTLGYGPPTLGDRLRKAGV